MGPSRGFTGRYISLGVKFLVCLGTIKQTVEGDHLQFSMV